MNGKLLIFTANSNAAASQTGTDNAYRQVIPKIAINESQNVDPFWKSEQLDAANLYSDLDSGENLVLRALALLGEALAHLGVALAIDPEASYVAFDTEVMRVRVVLESLFTLRSVGDGFASIVSGISLALKNAETNILDRRQITAIMDALQRIKRGPFMHFDTAMLVLDGLEDVGLDIEPTEMNGFLPSEYEEPFYRNDGTYGSTFENPSPQDSGAQANPERTPVSTAPLFDQRI